MAPLLPALNKNTQRTPRKSQKSHDCTRVGRHQARLFNPSVHTNRSSTYLGAWWKVPTKGLYVGSLAKKGAAMVVCVVVENVEPIPNQFEHCCYPTPGASSVRIASSHSIITNVFFDLHLRKLRKNLQRFIPISLFHKEKKSNFPMKSN